MCIDNRKVLRLPDHFAYVLRTGGASLGRVELYVYCAVAIGSVRAICLIGHDACGMVTLRARREKCIVGLVNNGGWVRGAAEEEFNKHAADFSIDDGAVFVLNEARRLRARYPGERVASLCYTLDDGLLYQCEAEAEVR
jgi:carbonic anhydrase